MVNSSFYSQLASAIVKQQEAIIGPMAWSQADKVKGIEVNDRKVVIKGDGKIVLNDLVQQYEMLFGRASVEVCRDAVRRLVGDMDKQALPAVLL